MGFAAPYIQRHGLRGLIETPPRLNTGITCVIPCFNEPGLIHTLHSVWSCNRPSCNTEVLIIVNHPQQASGEARRQNEKTMQMLQEWIPAHNSDNLRFYALCFPDIPRRHAGAGYARKMGMNEAIVRYENTGRADGIIVSMDADTLYSKNYLTGIEEHYRRYPLTSGTSNYFEHAYPPHEPHNATLSAAIKYELHLRYYLEGLRYAGFPAAFHTLGSAFTVKAINYCKAGGMNTRQAGEDFYFLNKIFRQGHFYEINHITAYPSPRVSDRVPFGTGPAVLRHLDKDLMTFAPESFVELKNIFACLPTLYEGKPLHPQIGPESNQFMQHIQAEKHIREIRQNTASLNSFKKRFFLWFDGLMIIHYLNFMHKKKYSKMEVSRAAIQMMQLTGTETQTQNTEELLQIYRKHQSGISRGFQ